MEAQLLQILEQQKEIWNRFSPGWKKWDNLTMDFLRPIGNQIIRFIKPEGNDLILDVASGTGEPGISIAARLNGGMVVATDVSEGMLEVAKENAVHRGIKNFDTVLSDVSELPFADSSFDAVSCRLGYMFFPDMSIATHEMARVLKPGGRIAVAVWGGPEKNSWASVTLSSINKHISIPAPPAGAPGLFRCAKPGLIADLFKQAGLKRITETIVEGKLSTGSLEVYWSFMTEVVAPVVAALSKADDETKTMIRNEVFETIGKNYSDNIAIDSSAVVIYGEK